jgi:hypothetical protein
MILWRPPFQKPDASTFSVKAVQAFLISFATNLHTVRSQSIIISTVMSALQTPEETKTFPFKKLMNSKQEASNATQRFLDAKFVVLMKIGLCVEWYIGTDVSETNCCPITKEVQESDLASGIHIPVFLYCDRNTTKKFSSSTIVYFI